VIRSALAVVAFALTGGAALSAVPPAQVRDPVWSPEGALLAYVRLTGSQGRIYVVDPNGRHRRVLTGAIPAPYGLAWAPDGSALAYVSDGDVWRIDVATGRRLDLTPGGQHYYEQPSWSSDGAEITFSAYGERFRTWKVDAVPAVGGPQRTIAELVRRPRYQPYGSLLLVSDPVTLVDPVTGAVVEQHAAGFYASWSPDGRVLSYSGAAGGIHVARPGGDDTVVHRAHGAAAFPVLSPLGTRIAFVLGARVLLLSRADGKVKALPRGDSRNDAPAWSARGALAYVARSACGPRSEIVVVRPDGSGARRLAGGC
jgi:Tol biopolymer transport system component